MKLQDLKYEYDLQRCTFTRMYFEFSVDASDPDKEIGTSDDDDQTLMQRLKHRISVEHTKLYDVLMELFPMNNLLAERYGTQTEQTQRAGVRMTTPVDDLEAVIEYTATPGVPCDGATITLDIQGARETGQSDETIRGCYAHVKEMRPATSRRAGDIIKRIENLLNYTIEDPLRLSALDVNT